MKAAEKLALEIAECERLAAENKNGSRTWWLARMHGLRYALSLLKEES